MIDPKTIRFKDVEKMRQFFAEHEDFSLLDLSMKYGVPEITMDKWQRICGLRMPDKKSKWTRDLSKAISDKAIWNTAEWFNQKYNVEGLGTTEIANLIGRNYSVTLKYFKKYNIKIRTIEEYLKLRTHKCCNREWLVEHYLTKRLSKSTCARLAGVSEISMGRWLSKFGILVRDRSHASALSYYRAQILMDEQKKMGK